MKRQLTEFGFDRSAFKLTIKKKPETMFISLDGLHDKVKHMHEKYEKYGFTGNDFLNAACKDPSLLKNSMVTMDKRIEANLAFLGSMGVSPETFFEGVKTQAQLLSIKPENIISRAKLLMSHHRLGYWSFSGKKEDVPEAQVLSGILLQRPMSFNLGNKNLKMRRVYALVKSPEKPAYMKLGSYLAQKESVEKRIKKKLLLERPEMYHRMVRLGYLSGRQKIKE